MGANALVTARRRRRTGNFHPPGPRAEAVDLAPPLWDRMEAQHDPGLPLLGDGPYSSPRDRAVGLVIRDICLGVTVTHGDPWLLPPPPPDWASCAGPRPPG